MSEKVQCKVYLPPDVKGMMDADTSRTNSEIVESALIHEYGGERKGALERRIEEKERRISMVRSEKNERERELEEMESKLDALRTRKRKAEQEHEQAREEMIERAVEQLTPDTWLTSIAKEEQIPDVTNGQLVEYAEELDMQPTEFRTMIVNRILEGEQ